MNDSEIIDLGISKISDSPTMAPKLSVTSKDDGGTIRLNNLPSLDTASTTLVDQLILDQALRC